MKSALRLLLVIGLALPLSLVAQSDADGPTHQAQLSTLLAQADSIRQAYESYTGQSLKDPSNAGARRLSIKLDGLTNDLDAYLIGKADKKLISGRAKEALTETKRYKSKQARALARSIEAVQRALTPLPKRLTAADVQWVRSKTTAAEVESAEAKATPVDEPAKPAEAAADEGAVERYADSGESSAPAGDATPAEAAVAETTIDPGAEASTDEEIGRRATAEAGMPGWLGWMAFALVLFNVGLLAALWAQGRQLSQLRQQVEDGLISLAAPRRADNRADEGLTALRDDLNQRWDELQAQTAEFAQRLDGRFRALEDLGHRVTQSYSQLTNRLAGYEQLSETVARLEQSAAAAPKTNGNGNGNGNHGKAELPPALQSPAGPPAAFTPTDRELLSGLLDQLQAITSLAPLSAAARSVIEGYSPEGSPDPVRVAVSPLELAQLVQLAHLSSLTEPTEDLYRQVVELYKREHVLVEDKMVGRMAFSDFYADNYTLEQLRQVEAPAEWALPLEVIEAAVSKSPLERVAVKGTVLYTVLPTVLRQADGVKAVLRKGLYVIKG